MRKESVQHMKLGRDGYMFFGAGQPQHTRSLTGKLQTQQDSATPHKTITKERFALVVKDADEVAPCHCDTVACCYAQHAMMQL